MKRQLFIISFLMIVFYGYSKEKKPKEKKIYIHGYIIDNSTKAGIDSVLITVMKQDSTTVDTLFAKEYNSDWDIRSRTYYYREVPAVIGKYIVKAEKAGYKTTFADFELKTIGRNRYITVPIIRMQTVKANSDIDGGSLDELVVKATKIKMVHRGDTIVYNADAFNVEEGGMLDALVRQLPGAELSSDGVITVNGEKIEELTLNGRDFFKGDNKVMLENLPSFTVKNIEVFRKTSEKDKWLGRNTSSPKLTMDVKLKRQYNTGLLGNLEAAGGTNDRYLGRFFGMRYTDCSRLSAFANINNVNEERRPGSKGDWDPTKTVPGQKESLQAGVNLNIDEKEHRWREEGSLTFGSTNTNDVSKTSSENYTSLGSNFSKNMSESKNKETKVNLSNDFYISLPKLWFSNYTNLVYGRFTNTGFSRGANSDKPLDKWGDVQSCLDSIFALELSPSLQSQLINRTSNRSNNTSTYSNIYTSFYTSMKLNSGDYMLFSLNGTLNKSESKNFNMQNIDYFRTSSSNVALNQYNTSPYHKHSYDASFGYMYLLSDDLNIKPGISYSQNYESSNNNFYLLDRLDGWGTGGKHNIGELPSTRNEMLQALDLKNTYNYTEMTKTTTLSIEPSWRHKNDFYQGWAYLSLPLVFEKKLFNYYSNALNSRLVNNKWKFTPTLQGNLSFKKQKIDLYFDVRFENNTPTMLQMTDRKNDANPLYIQLGNPDLKNTLSEYANFNIRKTWNKKNEIINSVRINWRAEQRAVSQGYTYDRTTGVYTFRPMNVDGNWNLDVNNNTTISFGESKKWNLNNDVGYSFVQSVDMAAVEGSTDSGISKVHTNSITEGANLNYTFKDLTIGATTNMNYCHSASERVDFQTVNATNYSYGLNLNYKIPWIKTTLATDIKMFSRRGYSSRDFNTDDLIWNASLSKSLLNGKLTAVIEAYDILHQMTNTNIFVNAQGRTETVTNTLPRYAMLHLRWNFNKMPKAKLKKN